MKRFLCILLVFLMVIPSAFALDHERFSLFAEVFGAQDIDDSKAQISDNYSRFFSDGCVITFEEENGEIVFAMISGQGDAFLAYCYAAMFQFDKDSNHATTNAGGLLYCYLRAHTETEKQFGNTVSGSVFVLRKEEEGYTFSIMK